MKDQFGNEVGPGLVGGSGQTSSDLPSYEQTQQDMSAIRQLMGQQGAGYMVTGNASASNGGNTAAYLPGMMTQAGITPTQGIINSYQQITGQQYKPGDTVTGYNNFGTGGTYDIRGANGQTSTTGMTGYGGFAGQPVTGNQTYNTKPLAVDNGTGTYNTKPQSLVGSGSIGGQPGSSGGAATSGGVINSAITPWNVSKDQTVAGNIESLIANDGPLMQQARTRAAQQMSARGLINSSLAASAADSAMYDVANTIAQSDAATRAKAAGYNVDQLNQQVTLDKQLANQMAQAQLSSDTSRYSTDVNANTQRLNNESAQLIARLNNDQQLTLQKMQNENQRLLQTNQQAAQAYNNSMQYIDVINRDPNLDSAAKTRAQAQIYYNLDTQLRTLSRVSGLDVSSNLSLANAPGFDDKGNYVGFDEQGNTKKP